MVFSIWLLPFLFHIILLQEPPRSSEAKAWCHSSLYLWCLEHQSFLCTWLWLTACIDLSLTNRNGFIFSYWQKQPPRITGGNPMLEQPELVLKPTARVSGNAERPSRGWSVFKQSLPAPVSTRSGLSDESHRFNTAPCQPPVLCPLCRYDFYGHQVLICV